MYQDTAERVVEETCRRRGNITAKFMRKFMLPLLQRFATVGVGKVPVAAGIRVLAQTAQAPWQSGVNTTYDDNPELARVAAAQQLLFPANPRALCEHVGLNWWAALKLHEDG